MDEVNWGVIGCGDVTEIKSGPPLYKTPRSRLVSVMRRDRAKAEDYARRHGALRAYDDAEMLIADPDVNAVYVATPPNLHARWAIAALEAGKAVYVEKPMGLNTAECRAINAAAQAAGRPLTIAYYRRRLPRFEKIRELIQDGAIGAPRCVTIVQRLPHDRLSGQAWKLDPSVGGGGHFVDMQTHALDWFAYLFGPPHDIQGIVRRLADEYAAEDFVSYIAAFGDVTVTGQFSYCVAEYADKFEIFGDRGSIGMSFFDWSPITLNRDGARETFEIADPEHAQTPMIAATVDYFLGEREPMSGR